MQKNVSFKLTKKTFWHLKNLFLKSWVTKGDFNTILKEQNSIKVWFLDAIMIFKLWKNSIFCLFSILFIFYLLKNLVLLRKFVIAWLIWIRVIVLKPGFVPKMWHELKCSYCLKIGICWNMKTNIIKTLFSYLIISLK